MILKAGDSNVLKNILRLICFLLNLVNIVKMGDVLFMKKVFSLLLIGIGAVSMFSFIAPNHVDAAVIEDVRQQAIYERGNLQEVIWPINLQAVVGPVGPVGPWEEDPRETTMRHLMALKTSAEWEALLDSLGWDEAIWAKAVDWDALIRRLYEIDWDASRLVEVDWDAIRLDAVDQDGIKEWR
mgnify:CR=1 FL=1